MTVTATSGTLAIGTTITAATSGIYTDNRSVLPATFITGQITGSAGSTGTYSVSKAQTVASSSLLFCGGNSDYLTGSDGLHPTPLSAEETPRWAAAKIRGDMLSLGL